MAKRTAARAPDACPSSQAGLRESRLFQKGSFLSRAGTGSVIPVTIGPCIDNHAYGNYDPRNGLFSIPRYGLIPTGRGPEAPGFGLRYVTADGRAALFKDSHNPAGATTWFFMSAQCIQRLPVYIGRTYFHNRDRVEPREFEPYKDAMLTRLRWKRWRGLRAEGAGTARVNTCEPICAVGRIERHRGAHITLSNPRHGSCKGQPAYFYTKASVTWPRGTGIRPRHQSYPLSPNCG